VKQGNIGEYEGNTTEKQMETKYSRYNTTPPQIKPYGWQTPFSLRKAAKQEELMGLMKIPANCLSVSMYLISNVSLLNVTSQKVVSPLKVSHSFVEDWIFWL
jgi:hypothetical protein